MTLPRPSGILASPTLRIEQRSSQLAYTIEDEAGRPLSRAVQVTEADGAPLCWADRQAGAPVAVVVRYTIEPSPHHPRRRRATTRLHRPLRRLVPAAHLGVGLMIPVASRSRIPTRSGAFMDGVASIAGVLILWLIDGSMRMTLGSLLGSGHYIPDKANKNE
ncbi:hypothetical protein ACQEU3_20705 [Spirillospora sp. CA-253888]